MLPKGKSKIDIGVTGVRLGVRGRGEVVGEYWYR